MLTAVCALSTRDFDSPKYPLLLSQEAPPGPFSNGGGPPPVHTMPQGGGDSGYLPDSNVYGGGDSIIDGGMAPLPGWFSDGVVMAGGGEPLEPPPGGDEEEEHDDDEEEEDVGAAAVERRQAAMQPEPSGTHQTPVPCNRFSGKPDERV